MSMREFLSDRMAGIIIRVIAASAGAGFLLFTGTQAGIVLLLLLALLPVFIGTLLFEYFRQRSRLRQLESIMAGLDQKYLFAECVPPPGGLYERRLFDLTRRAGQAMTAAVSESRAAGREYREYVERWVHEIKTPITAARLICRKLDGDTRRRITGELDQIQTHVDRALFYARAESPEQDCILHQTDLSRIVSQAIDNHRSLLIQNGIRVETEGLNISVYTDEKWAEFILGQLLQNAARYRGQDPVITISAGSLGEQVRLSVRDNGIGIPAHELPRVFQRGYTGSNGRARGGSTGMGLYLCKKLSGFLELDLRITSEEGAGTTAVLTFPAKELPNI